MTQRISVVNCLAERKTVGRSKCGGCEYNSGDLVGCKHLSRSVPTNYCTRVCTLQSGERGPAQGDEGPTRMGERLPPLTGPAMCGAPWVIQKWGSPRPIFDRTPGAEPIEDPATNVVPGCSFPRQLQVGEIEV